MHANANMIPSNGCEIGYEFISWMHMQIWNHPIFANDNMHSSHECACMYEIISCMQKQLWNHLMNGNADIKASDACGHTHGQDLQFKDGCIIKLKTHLYNWWASCASNSIYLQVEEDKGCLMNQFID